VDISFFQKKEVLFTFLPRHENEARSFVINNIPYIRHKYPTFESNKIFLQEAIERNKDSIWNADTQEIVSQADLYLEQSSNVIENFNMIEALGIVLDDQQRTIPTTQAHEKVQKLFLGDDNTSVGTLFTTAQNESMISTTNTFQRQITPSTTTARSQGTTLTIEEVDNKLTLLSSDMQKIHQLLSSLLKGNNINEMDISQDNNNITTKVTGEQSNSTCEKP
jgi:hypothetical protein